MSDQSVNVLDLNQYRWQNRLLLVFAPAVTDPQLHKQSAWFTSQPLEFQDRDLLTFYLTEEAIGESENVRFSPEEVTRLQEQYSVQSGTFAVLLIGKDGGLKYRFDEPVTAEEIFARIDAMPMRVQEMRTSGQ